MIDRNDRTGSLPVIKEPEATIVPTKVCSNCGAAKVLANFYKNPNCADGHVNDCIDCKNAATAMRKAMPNEISVLLHDWGRADGSFIS